MRLVPLLLAACLFGATAVAAPAGTSAKPAKKAAAPAPAAPPATPSVETAKAAAPTPPPPAAADPVAPVPAPTPPTDAREDGLTRAASPALAQEAEAQVAATPSPSRWKRRLSIGANWGAAMRRSEVPSGQLLDGALVRAAAGVGLELHPDLALRAEVGLEAGVGNSLRRMDAALLASLSLRAPLSVEVGPYLAGMGSASSQRGAALGLRARLEVGSAFGLGAVLAWNVSGSGSFAPRATPWLLVGADLTLESSVER